MNPIKSILLCLFILTVSCSKRADNTTNMAYTSAITFLYYKDFSYGIHFMENILQLELIKDDGFARVYQVNQKAFLGIVQAKDDTKPSGSTLVSLTTHDVEVQYDRVKELEVYDLTEIKRLKAIPLKSFFFYDVEGHQFEIQEFLDKDDQLRF